MGAIGRQGKNGSAKLSVATLEARQNRKFHDGQPILPSRQELDYLPPSATSAMPASPMEVFYNRPRARQSLAIEPLFRSRLQSLDQTVREIRVSPRPRRLHGGKDHIATLLRAPRFKADDLVALLRGASVLVAA